MKKFEAFLVVGFFELVLAIVLLAWVSTTEPIMMEQTGNVMKAWINPLSLQLLIIGLMLLSSGISTLFMTTVIYKLEKEK